jgi:hypothetical protein
VIAATVSATVAGRPLDQARTGHSGCSRRIPLSNLPSRATISRPKSTGATCSADSCTSTGKLHERICAPYATGSIALTGIFKAG